MRKSLIFLTLIFILCGCSDSSSKFNIRKLMSENEYIIIDVRTIEEFEKSHVIGAINIPYDKFNSNVNLDKSKVIFVYCMSGARSEVAYNYLKDLGYEVYNLGSFSSIDLPKK